MLVDVLLLECHTRYDVSKITPRTDSQSKELEVSLMKRGGRHDLACDLGLAALLKPYLSGNNIDIASLLISIRQISLFIHQTTRCQPNSRRRLLSAFASPFIFCCLHLSDSERDLLNPTRTNHRLDQLRQLYRSLTMAPGKPAAEFNAIINAGMGIAFYPRLEDVANPLADRQRRKNEALAEEIFTKNRRSSAPGSGITNRKPGTGPSLASRIGISKVDYYCS